jgi:hypothetical protein
MATANVTARAIARAAALKEMILDFSRIPDEIGLATDFDFAVFDKILERGVSKQRLVRSLKLHFWKSDRIEAEVFFQINWVTMDAEAQINGATIELPTGQNASQSLSQRLGHLRQLVVKVARVKKYHKMSWLIYWRNDNAEIRGLVDAAQKEFNLVPITSAHQAVLDSFRSEVASDLNGVTRGVEPDRLKGVDAGFTYRRR